MKILFLQVYSTGIGAYFKYVASINSAYCIKHGYDYKAVIGSIPHGYHMTWAKVFSIINECKEYDYLFFLDADAIVLNHNISLENRILQMKGDVAFSETGANGGDIINSGAMIMKCSEQGKAFINDVYKASLLDEYKAYKTGLWHEQTIMTKLYESGRYNGIVEIFDVNFINSYWLYNPESNDGQFIFHFMARNISDKIAVARSLFNSRFLAGW